MRQNRQANKVLGMICRKFNHHKCWHQRKEFQTKTCTTTTEKHTVIFKVCKKAQHLKITVELSNEAARLKAVRQFISTNAPLTLMFNGQSCFLERSRSCVQCNNHEIEYLPGENTNTEKLYVLHNWSSYITTPQKRHKTQIMDTKGMTT